MPAYSWVVNNDQDELCVRYVDGDEVVTEKVDGGPAEANALRAEIDAILNLKKVTE